MASLDDFIKIASSLSELQRQKDAVQRQVEDAQQNLTRVLQEAEQRARVTIDGAQAQAFAIIQTAQAKQEEVAQRESDVAIREQAVAWVDAKITELNDRAEALLQSEQLAEQARADARAQQQHWVSKLDELKAKEEALALREANLSQPTSS